MGIAWWCPCLTMPSLNSLLACVGLLALLLFAMASSYYLVRNNSISFYDARASGHHVAPSGLTNEVLEDPEGLLKMSSDDIAKDFQLALAKAALFAPPHAPRVVAIVGLTCSPNACRGLLLWWWWWFCAFDSRSM